MDPSMEGTEVDASLSTVKPLESGVTAPGFPTVRAQPLQGQLPVASTKY